MISLATSLRLFSSFSRPNFAGSLSRHLHASKGFSAQPKLPVISQPELSASRAFEEIAKDEKVQVKKKEYNCSSANFKISPRKLNMLAKQIRGLPLNEAIIQMEFSPKRAAKRIMKNLVLARKHMTEQNHIYMMKPENVVISQAFVGKGRYLKRIKPHARGRFGIMHHPSAHIKYVLKDIPPKPKEKSPGEITKVRKWKLTKKPWVTLVENKPIYNADPRMYDKW